MNDQNHRAAREAARHADGRFGEQALPDPGATVLPPTPAQMGIPDDLPELGPQPYLDSRDSFRVVHWPAEKPKRACVVCKTTIEPGVNDWPTGLLCRRCQTVTRGSRAGYVHEPLWTLEPLNEVIAE